MRAWRSVSRLVVVSIRVLVRRGVRNGRASQTCVGAALIVVARVVVPGACGTLTRHSLAAAVVAGALAIARGFVGPGLSELLGIIAALSVGAIAVSAAICIARQTTRPDLPVRAGALLTATVLHVAPAHRQLLSVRALEVVCDPRAALTTAWGLVRHPRSLVQSSAARPMLVKGAGLALESLLLRRLLKHAPGLGPMLGLAGAYQMTVSSARFIHHFESSAAALCAASTA